MKRECFYTRTKTLSIVLVIFSLNLSLWESGCSTADRFEIGYTPDTEPLENVYDTTTVQTVTGQIFDLDSFMYDDDIAIVNFKVRGFDGNLYWVQLAPAWYLKVKSVYFREGQKITITGSFLDMIEDEEEEEEEEEIEDLEDANNFRIIIAQKIWKKGKVLALRDKKGKPLWYRRGMLMGRQLYIQKYLDDLRSGKNPDGPVIPQEIRQNINQRSFPPFH